MWGTVRTIIKRDEKKKQINVLLIQRILCVIYIMNKDKLMNGRRPQQQRNAMVALLFDARAQYLIILLNYRIGSVRALNAKYNTFVVTK